MLGKLFIQISTRLPVLEEMACWSQETSESRSPVGNRHGEVTLKERAQVFSRLSDSRAQIQGKDRSVRLGNVVEREGGGEGGEGGEGEMRVGGR